MKKVFVKLENIPTGGGAQKFDEIWIPVHEIHSIARVGAELIISYTDVVRSSAEGGGLAMYSYKHETEEAVQNTITRISDAMIDVNHD